MENITNERIINLIHKIQDSRNSKVLVYITGDRARLETRIGMDVIPKINDHLTNLGDFEKLDLFL